MRGLGFTRAALNMPFWPHERGLESISRHGHVGW